LLFFGKAKAGIDIREKEIFGAHRLDVPKIRAYLCWLLLGILERADPIVPITEPRAYDCAGE
jgi:hypothetical protein